MSVRTGEAVAMKSTRRAVVARGFAAAGALLGFGALAVFGGSIGLGAGLNVAGSAQGTQVTVAAPAVSLVCPIPLSQGADTVGDLGLTGNEASGPQMVRTHTVALINGAGQVGFGALKAPSVEGDAESGSNDPNASENESSEQQAPEVSPLAAPIGGTNEQPKAAIVRSADQSGAFLATTKNRSVAASNEFSTAALLSGNTSGDARGIAAASCGAAASEHWLMGGSTAVGSSTKLVVQNPSVTPATVTLTLWGPSGRIELAGSQTLLVPGGGQVETLLEGVAAEQRRLGVHVEAQGALVTAYLEHKELDGLTPHGVDYVTGTAAPSRVQVLSGVALFGEKVDAETASFVRILVPDFSAPENLAEQSEDDAAEVTQDVIGTARVTLVGPSGNVVLFGAQDIDLVSGQVHDVSLAGAPRGVYSLVVESDVPMVAGAKALREGTADPATPLLGAPLDFAWVSAAPVFSSPLFDTRQSFVQNDVRSSEISDELVASSSAGAVALPPGIEGTLSLAGLPALDSVAQFAQVVAEIPRDYSALAEGSAQNTETETDEQKLARENWKPQITATVTAFKADGSVAGTKSVALAFGQSLAVALSDFPDASALSVTDVAGGIVDWSVSFSAKAIPGSTTRIAPIAVTQEPATVVVSRAAQLD